MACRSVKTTAVKIFEKLTNAKEYRNGFAEQKHHIVTQLVTIQDELTQFAQAPGRLTHEVNGFLMEWCARFSNQLPKNTPKAQYISEVVLNRLHDCALSNPDYLWLKIRGRRMTLTGIGEVKSHPVSMTHRPRQLFFQEINIRNLIKCGKIPPLISKRYHVTLADTFVRYLIMPRSTDAPHTLPASAPLGWEIKEIEFTLPEIIFLRRLLCDDIPPSQNLNDVISPYSRKEYKSFVYAMITQVEEIIADLFKNLLPADQQHIRSDLALWSMIWNSIPTNHESINLATQWIHATTQHLASSYSLIAKPPSSLTQLDIEKISSCFLIQSATNGNSSAYPRGYNSSAYPRGYNSSAYPRGYNSSPHRDTLYAYPRGYNTSLAYALTSRLQEIKQDFPNPPELPCKQEIDIFALL